MVVLLCYLEPQILDIFKNTLPSRLCWVLFPIKDFRLRVETAKMILRREKIDRQLSGQSGTVTAFIMVNENNSVNIKGNII